MLSLNWKKGPFLDSILASDFHSRKKEGCTFSSTNRVETSHDQIFHIFNGHTSGPRLKDDDQINKRILSSFFSKIIST